MKARRATARFVTTSGDVRARIDPDVTDPARIEIAARHAPDFAVYVTADEARELADALGDLARLAAD